MASITDTFKDIFLAGVGALAIGAEKSQEMIDQLVQKGQITVDQGKEIAEQVKGQTIEGTAQLRDDIIKAQMKMMTKEERDEFAARVADMASQVDVEDAMMSQEKAEVASAANAQESK